MQYSQFMGPKRSKKREDKLFIVLHDVSLEYEPNEIYRIIEKAKASDLFGDYAIINPVFYEVKKNIDGSNTIEKLKSLCDELEKQNDISSKRKEAYWSGHIRTILVLNAKSNTPTPMKLIDDKSISFFVRLTISWEDCKYYDSCVNDLCAEICAKSFSETGCCKCEANKDGSRCGCIFLLLSKIICGLDSGIQKNIRELLIA